MANKEEREKIIKEARDSVERIQEFDPNSIARVEDLGRDLNFSDAVDDATRIVDLFRQVAIDLLPEMSHQRLNAAKQSADSQFSMLNQMVEFSVSDQQSPKQARDNLVQQVQNSYDDVFEKLSPAIAYSVKRSTDFARMERDAHAAIQSIEDRTAELEEELRRRQEEANSALETIRTLAAEQGVSQQAIFFKNESDRHESESKAWLKRTMWLATLLAAYALSTAFLHKWSVLTPANTFESVQLVASKALVFATVAFLLVLSARNFMAHRHNAVINKHRQNSLATYRALVDAAGDQANRDVVLTRAADCIFSAQMTGFAKSSGQDGKSLSMVNMSPSSLGPSGAE